MLQLENISLKLGTFSLKNLSMDVKKGEYLVILGPTGTGKTVLMETIAGLHQPDTGSIFLNNREVTSLPPENRNIGMVYQDYALFPHLTVLENVKLAARHLDEPLRSAQAAGLLARVNLDGLEARTPDQLSGGERQRVAVVRALINAPKLLLGDEPTGSLDQAASDNLVELLIELNREEGTTLIVVTHSTDLARRMDRMLELTDGLLLEKDNLK